MPPGQTRPLVVVRDPAMRSELERYCAAAGLDPEMVEQPERARRGWSTARCVVVGAECARDVATMEQRRRDDVVVVAFEPEEAQVWRDALSIHAEHVCMLPDGRQWLVSWLVEAGERDGGEGRAVGVIAGRGGAGSSTYAVALAREAVRMGLRAFLLDGDPLAGGLELVVGCEHAPGLRWPEVTAAGGRVAASALRSALPSSDGLAVLSSSASVSPHLHDVREVVVSSRRGVDLVVADLPRRVDAELLDVVSALDVLIVVTTADVRAVAGSRRIVESLRACSGDVRVAVRTSGAALVSPHEIAVSLGVPLATAFSTRRATHRAIDEGRGPALGGRDRREIRRLVEGFLEPRHQTLREQ
jgi:secretion/DNA translocation related CpaE-like protein